MRREIIDDRPHEAAPLGIDDRCARSRNVGLEQIDVGLSVLVADARRQRDRPPAAVLAMMVAGLVGRDGEEPRLEAPGPVEGIDRQVNLKEGLLEEAYLFQKLMRTDDAQRNMKRFLEIGGQTRDGELEVNELSRRLGLDQED